MGVTLQFSDKAQVIAQNEAIRSLTRFSSRRQVEKACRALEALRNNLAHSQDIVSCDWETIVILATDLDGDGRFDIVALTGLPEPEIGDTVACPENPVALERISVDEPTLSMLFTINSSPLAGRDGKFVTSRHLRARLYRELESNVALEVPK